jgi:hypothetical protein
MNATAAAPPEVRRHGSGFPKRPSMGATAAVSREVRRRGSRFSERPSMGATATASQEVRQHGSRLPKRPSMSATATETLTELHHTGTVHAKTRAAGRAWENFAAREPFAQITRACASQELSSTRESSAKTPKRGPHLRRFVGVVLLKRPGIGATVAASQEGCRRGSRLRKHPSMNATVTASREVRRCGSRLPGVRETP